MAIYHFSAKVICRANGSSALAAAAYRSASRLHDERLDRHHDFSNKAGVVHSEVMLPDGAPERLRDRDELWNAVEAGEKRKDAQLAREIEFAIPREMNRGAGHRSWRATSCKREFVDRGMVADLNVHWDIGAGRQAEAARACDADHARGGRGRVRARRSATGTAPSCWSTGARRGASTSTSGWPSSGSTRGSITAPMKRRASTLEPQHKIGPAASRMAGAGAGGASGSRSTAHRAREWREDHRRSRTSRWTRSRGSRRRSRPATWRCSCTGISDGKEQFDQVMAAVRGIAGAGRARQGRARRGAVHQPRDDRDRAAAGARGATSWPIASGSRCRRSASRRARSTRAEARGLVLSGEQRDALRACHRTTRAGVGRRLCRHRQVGDAGRRARGLGGRRLHGARRGAVRASPPRIWKAVRASRRARSPASNINGRRGASC